MLTLFEGQSGVRDTVRFMEEKLSAGLWTWHLHTDEMQWSHGLFLLLGLDPNSIVPSFSTLLQMTLAEDRKELTDAERLVRRDQNFDREFRFLRPDGRLRWCRNHGEVVRSRSDNQPLVVGMMVDVTAASETRLLKADIESRFQALTAASGGSVWSMRPDGWVLEYYGQDGANGDLYLGNSWRELIHVSDISSVDATLEQVARRAESARLEPRFREPDGHYRWKRITIVPVEDAFGHVTELICTVADIQAERTLPETPANKNDHQITGAQLRAARGLVKLSVNDLSKRSGVSPSLIRRCESVDDFFQADPADGRAIADALFKAGARFYFHSGAKPMVGPR